MLTPPLLRWLILGVVLFLAPVAIAADGLDKNIQLLSSSTDFRVRTQAALALGASRSERAVTPLCQALADDNRTVRIASATALSRLRMGGEGCIQRRISAESDSMVVAALKKALERLGGGGGAEPAIGAGTKFYIAIDKLAGPERLDSSVRGAFVKAARGRSEVAFAPRGQSQASASEELAKFKAAKGYLLAPKLSRPTYDGGVLQVKISVAIMSYPGGALIGSYSKSVGMPGISSENPAAENELVLLVAEEAMKQFLQIAPTLN
jgi:hypothetical protein